MAGRGSAVSGIPLVAAHSFLRHQVGPGAVEPGGFDAFMHIEVDVVLCRRFNHFLKMAHHVLSMMMHSFRANRAGVTGFQVVDSKLAAERQGRIELTFIHGNITTGFVMRNKLNLMFLCIFHNFLNIEIRISFAEILLRNAV
ncbi:hypothetical protein SDC9_89769 [bioreactor metagenome]|uniref:Uncharacterized protein n=1 Tax=bioreactor metagenome TaxID=1076179 RepID=A0A644ZQQ5_9ZZZZ